MEATEVKPATMAGSGMYTNAVVLAAALLFACVLLSSFFKTKSKGASAARSARSVGTQTSTATVQTASAHANGMSIHRRRASSAWESKASTKEMLVYLSSKGCASASPFVLAAGIDSLDKLGSQETLDALEKFGVSAIDASKIRQLFANSDGSESATATTKDWYGGMVTPPHMTRGSPSKA